MWTTLYRWRNSMAPAPAPKPIPGRAAGGYARARNQTPEQRRAIARKAAAARWGIDRVGKRA